MIYLASPYSVTNKEGLTEQAIKNRLTRRFKKVCKKAADLMLSGEVVFCPIAHSHPIEVLGFDGKRGDHDFWLKQDFAVLDRSDELVVYRMQGWKQSYGVNAEIERATERGIPIRYID
jgi:hypothetical protein